MLTGQRRHRKVVEKGSRYPHGVSTRASVVVNPVKASRKYLERHAESDAHLTWRLAEPMAHAVVIPAYGEGGSLLAAVRSVPQSVRGQVLIVIVVNARVDSEPWVHRANQKIVTQLHEAYPACTSVDAQTTLHQAPQGNLVLMQRTLPLGQGVGLARKLGVDLVFGLWSRGGLQTSWIHCTDADVRVPKDYFEQVATTSGAAALYPFWHVSGADPLMANAAAQYEISLRYYVIGLRWAGSSYGFHTIGSTVTVDAGAYARVRGFPKRNAAEDFYLLNKLAKVGRIEQTAGDPIMIEGRVSTRVPFGTGRAMGDAAAGKPMATCYHPETFRCLRGVLAAVEWGVSRGCIFAEALKSDHLAVAGTEHCARMQFVADAVGLPAALESARAACQTVPTLRRRMREWLDAFRTLKLIHGFRDAGLPSMEPQQALRMAPFVDTSAWQPQQSFDAIRHHLVAAEAKQAAASVSC